MALKIQTAVPGQLWCCSKGCGECHPALAISEYSRTTNAAGEIEESKKEEIFVSSCCGVELWLWDERVEDNVDWDFSDVGQQSESQDGENEIYRNPVWEIGVDGCISRIHRA